VGCEVAVTVNTPARCSSRPPGTTATRPGAPAAIRSRLASVATQGREVYRYSKDTAKTGNGPYLGCTPATRVSTDDQNLALRLDAVKQAPAAGRVFRDVDSGVAEAAPPTLMRALSS
jgi:hypothetical protein